MKIGKYFINRETPNRVYIRRIKPLLDSQFARATPWGAVEPMDILTTNVCNLKCFSCSALCDKPIGTDNVLRREAYILPIDNLRDFLENVKGWGGASWIRITGGEPTTLPSDKLEAYIFEAKTHGFKVDLLTNCFKLPEYLEERRILPDYFTLDLHGKNQAEVDKSAAALKGMGLSYKILTVTKHFDLQLRRARNITEGARCERHLNNISLDRNVVYPCCAGRVVEAWDNTNAVSDALYKAGWNIYNPNLPDTINNWRKTLPPEWFKLCMLSCWNKGEEIEYRRNVD